MNLLTYDCLAQHESPPAAWRILNFDATRAGREVANAASITVVDHDRVQAFRWGEELLIGALDLPLSRIIHRTWGDDAPVCLMPSGATVDQEPVFDDEDADADIVRWFAEQQAAAEEATRADVAVVREGTEANEEVMLTRRNGSRSRRSWRGGGTMYRR